MEEKVPFKPMTPEERREFGKQFSPKEKQSYYKGKRQAYSHMANAARRQSIFVSDNLKGGEVTPKGETTPSKGNRPKGGKPKHDDGDLPF